MDERMALLVAADDQADAGQAGPGPLATDDLPLASDDLLVEEVSIDGICGVY